MEISAEQLNRLKDGEYTVYDIRSETDRTYGFIPGSVHITAESSAKIRRRTETRR